MNQAVEPSFPHSAGILFGMGLGRFFDGIFHASTCVFVVAGLAVLWRRAHRRRRPVPTSPPSPPADSCNDPRTTLAQCLNAMLALELANNAGWELL